MNMIQKSDIEIAQSAKILHIKKIAEKLNLTEDDIEYYGKHKAKINLDVCNRRPAYKESKLILTTAITPTPAGEGKSTTTIGLGQALNRLGKNCTVALREPSLGPCFGLKGGATGGGYAQVIPMEDINLHFTGDIHAISTAHNLLSAVIGNHLKHGNALGINPQWIYWKRAVDMNDRSLRNIVIGLGGDKHGVPREDGFLITVASEIMAIFCLSRNYEDLKRRLGDIVIADNFNGDFIRARDLNVVGAMAALLKDALKPNLVQTLENTPAIIHGGPFANIAHGCNSILATEMALNLSEYVVTEAGFGADLGAEKFFDIKCRMADLDPSCVVLVASARALKMHGGVSKTSLLEENTGAVEKGFANLEKHIENIKKFNVPLVVAINRFPADTQTELDIIAEKCNGMGVKAVISDVWAHGGEGGIQLAEKVLDLIKNEKSQFRPLYENNISVKKKIETIATEIYGARSVLYTDNCNREIEKLEQRGFGNLPVCISKTQNSLSDNPLLAGCPKNFDLTVKSAGVSAGAGFIVAMTGDILSMPGLPQKPAAENINIDSEGKISGLF